MLQQKEVKMSYKDYKNEYSYCKTVKGSYDADTKSIIVLIPDSQNKELFNELNKVIYIYNDSFSNPESYKDLDHPKRKLSEKIKELRNEIEANGLLEEYEEYSDATSLKEPTQYEIDEVINKIFHK